MPARIPAPTSPKDTYLGPDKQEEPNGSALEKKWREVGRKYTSRKCCAILTTTSRCLLLMITTLLRQHNPIFIFSGAQPERWTPGDITSLDIIAEGSDSWQERRYCFLDSFRRRQTSIYCPRTEVFPNSHQFPITSIAQRHRRSSTDQPSTRSIPDVSGRAGFIQHRDRSGAAGPEAVQTHRGPQ